MSSPVPAKPSCGPAPSFETEDTDVPPEGPSARGAEQPPPSSCLSNGEDDGYEPI